MSTSERWTKVLVWARSAISLFRPLMSLTSKILKNSMALLFLNLGGSLINTLIASLRAAAPNEKILTSVALVLLTEL